jgi:hypothetical protein
MYIYISIYIYTHDGFVSTQVRGSMADAQMGLLLSVLAENFTETRIRGPAVLDEGLPPPAAPEGGVPLLTPDAVDPAPLRSEADGGAGAPAALKEQVTPHIPTHK